MYRQFNDRDVNIYGKVVTSGEVIKSSADLVL